MRSIPLPRLPRKVVPLGLVVGIWLFLGHALAGEVTETEAPSEKVAEAARTATVGRLTDSIKLLASDELDGRGVGTEGLDDAAEYLANQFRELGLRTDWFESNGPFQKFTVTSKTELGEGEKNHLAFVIESDAGERQWTELQLAEQFSPLALGNSGSCEAGIVFVGYGITAEDIGYDDYADVDVEGKVVLMLRKEPQQDDPDSPFAGKRSSPHATFQKKVDNALAHNVAAVIMVNDESELKKNERAERRRMKVALDKLTELQQEFEETEAPDESVVQKYLGRISRQSKIVQASAAKLREQKFDRVLTLKEAGSRSRAEIPVFFAAREIVEPLIGASLDTDLLSLEKAIDEDLQPCSAPLAHCSAKGATDIVVREWKVKNVVGVLEGEGPLADETIVIGAHYDHLGKGGPGSLAPWTVDIHNGADDNASGTATLLELARRFASREEKPRRRMVFIAFTGEERGLLGSKHYVRNPRFPLDQTVAMINLDMVGRLADNELTLYGTGTAEEFDELVDDLNEDYRFDIEKKPGGYGPSDHASFYPQGIPVLFFFTGMHKDYHRPSDDWDKINYEGMTRITEMVENAISAIDGADQRPTYVKKNRIQSAIGDWRGNRRARRGDDESDKRPLLGIVPDGEATGDGCVVGQVIADGPAEKAGLQTGDVIIKVAQRPVEGLAGIGQALLEHQPGDKVDIVVRRDGKEMTLEVKLGSAP
jgi:hypothetical protein